MKYVRISDADSSTRRKSARLTGEDTRELLVDTFVQTFIREGQFDPIYDDVDQYHIEDKIARLTCLVGWIYQTMSDNASPNVQKEIQEIIHQCVGPCKKVEFFEKDEAS